MQGNIFSKIKQDRIPPTTSTDRIADAKSQTMLFFITTGYKTSINDLDFSCPAIWKFLK